MMEKRILIILLILVHISCSSQEGIEEELQNCIKKELRDLRPESRDFYEVMIEMEGRMMENGLLMDNNRKSYQDLLKSISTESGSAKEFHNQNIAYLSGNLPFFLFLANDIIFNQCPYKVSFSKKEQYEKIFKQGQLQNRIMESGFNNLKLNHHLIESIEESDFENIAYRAPVIYLTLINMDLKYDPAYEQLERYKKDKHFLNKN